MRGLLVGTVDFSRHCLGQLIEHRANPVAILTLAREDAGFHSDYADLSDLACKHGIPLYQIKNINHPQVVEIIKGQKPDVVFVFGWSQIISEEIRNLPPLGCIGAHPALLPRNRGRHPIVWALVEGLEESGLTFFYLDQGVDSGDIIWQKPFEITIDDDAASVYQKIKDLAGEAIPELLSQLEQGKALRIPQDHSQATYWRKRTTRDGVVDWKASTNQIYNLIRALTHPYIGAHTYLDGGKVVIWKSRLTESPTALEALKATPGTVFAQADGVLSVRTGDGHIDLTDWHAPASMRISVGQRLSEKSVR